MQKRNVHFNYTDTFGCRESGWLTIDGEITGDKVLRAYIGFLHNIAGEPCDRAIHPSWRVVAFVMGPSGTSASVILQSDWRQVAGVVFCNGHHSL